MSPEPESSEMGELHVAAPTLIVPVSESGPTTMPLQPL
jgi:hypothetical protein